MSRLMESLTGEPWAIEPSWLPLLAAIATRQSDERPWERFDVEAAMGPMVQKIPETRRAFLADTVAVLPIIGPILPRANLLTEISGATSLAILQQDLDAVLGNSNVGEILLMIDSPGGHVTGVGAFVDRLAAARKIKPISAFVSGSASSAAYWIASATAEIAIDRTAILGSIGVVLTMSKQVTPDASGKMSIEIVSSNAPRKRPDPDEEDGQQEVRRLLDAIETQMIADIAKGRRVSADRVKNDFGAGGVRVGPEAVQLGMADRVDNYENVLRTMARRAVNDARRKKLRR